VNGPTYERSGAYRWWYLDAVSDDGRRALVAVLFSGAVFSPYYAARLRLGEPALPDEHAAIHLALYEDGKRILWTLGEQRMAIEARGWDVSLSGSSLRRANDRLRLTLDERWPRQMRGEIELEAEAPALTPEPILLAPGAAGHLWHGRVPRARARVKLLEPDFSFVGRGYHDANAGPEPLERTLRGWVWSREHEGNATRVQYDVLASNGARFRHAFGTEPDVDLRGAQTLWRVQLPASIGGARPTRVIESAPFYARFLLARGAFTTGMGESLDLARFDRGVVRWMLRWKTARRTG
jgi:carotenoid 1,2-hydratase